jgi:hypothetical protein
MTSGRPPFLMYAAVWLVCVTYAFCDHAEKFAFAEMLKYLRNTEQLRISHEHGIGYRDWRGCYSYLPCKRQLCRYSSGCAGTVPQARERPDVPTDCFAA